MPPLPFMPRLRDGTDVRVLYMLIIVLKTNLFWIEDSAKKIFDDETLVSEIHQSYNDENLIGKICNEQHEVWIILNSKEKMILIDHPIFPLAEFNPIPNVPTPTEQLGRGHTVCLKFQNDLFFTIEYHLFIGKSKPFARNINLTISMRRRDATRLPIFATRLWRLVRKAMESRLRGL